MNIIKELSKRHFTIKLRAGGFYFPVNCEVVGNSIHLSFGYNKELLEEIKISFEKRKWLGLDGGPKVWSVPITYRNLFQLESLMGKYGTNPYNRYDKAFQPIYFDAITEHCKKRGIKLYKHQIEMVNQGLITHWCEWAGRMGLGKTLSAIILLEMVLKESNESIWWIGPKNPLVAVQLDFKKWKTHLRPSFMTYEALKSTLSNWTPGEKPPRFLILDEASRTKTPTAQRTIAAKHLADSMRATYGLDCYIILLSGTPAPKEPTDWWSQLEITCPGYLREATAFTFRERLGFCYDREFVPGAGKHRALRSWKDNEAKCAICGEVAGHINHYDLSNKECHKYVKSINQVALLHKRLKGAVGVWLKEECLDLPAKRYKVITVEPAKDLLRLAKSIVNTTPRVTDALIKLRTLSDGFLYEEKENGKRRCDVCHGHKEIMHRFDTVDPNLALSREELIEKKRFIWSTDEEPEIIDKIDIVIEEKLIECPNCLGEGEVPVYERIIKEVPCPKDKVLENLLEDHEEDGRLNVYAGFTGSIDRVVKLCGTFGWSTIRCDGRGWSGKDSNGNDLGRSDSELLDMYMNGTENYIAFVGQPGAAGMGLNLVASPSTFFFSNDHNGESREQAEDRGHRIGMNEERGGLIIDVVHLPSDRKVLENLRMKRDLQYMSLTGLKEIYNVE